MINFTYLVNEAAQISGIAATKIWGRSKHAALVRARWAIYYVAAELGTSELSLAWTFKRTHSTIQHGILSAKALIKRDADFSVLVHELLRKARHERSSAPAFIIEEAAQQLAVEAIQNLIALNQKNSNAFRQLIAEMIANAKH